MTSAVALPALSVPPAAPPRPRPARVALAALPWLFPLAAFLYGQNRAGTPAGDVVVYLLYFALGVVLPGTLVHRALRGSRGNRPEDLGLGAATGLLVQLIGWALAAATGLQALLPGWPALIVVVFLAVPRLRRNWRIADPRPLPLRWSWLISGVLVMMTLAALPYWLRDPLPPAPASYYQDLMYHLALVHEMTRSIPFQVPQLAGDTLRYHYLSDADMAAASMITKIPPAVVLLRLWLVPIMAVTVFVTAVLARELAGKWWTGPLAAAGAMVSLPLSLGAPIEPFGETAITGSSPSLSYSLPLLGLLVLVAVDVLNGRSLRWGWLIVFPLALACAGAKSSALPPFVAGLVLAGLVIAWRYRDRLPATAALFGLTAAAMVVGLKLFAGGGASTLALQPLAILFWVRPYRETIGAGDADDGSLFLPTGVDHATTAGALFLAGLIVWWLLAQAPRTIGLITMVGRRTRAEPASWLLAGITAAGAGLVWALWHPSASQVYFWLGVVPIGAALAARALADHARHWAPVVAGLLAGAIWSVLAPAVATPSQHTIQAWTYTLAVPLLRTLAIAAAAAVLGLLGWRLARGRYVWHAVPVALIAAVLGGSIAVGAEHQAGFAVKTLMHPHPVLNPQKMITEPEARAALWLDQHAGRDDVVATNVHCQPLGWRAACDARAFWVAGLGGRRTLIESWGYTDQAVAADGVDGLRYNMQPAPYPDRFALNQRVFAKADPADIATLRSQYHVRWLFADARAAGGVAPALARVTTLRYTAGPVTIYALP